MVEKLSFDLSPEMLKALAQEFDLEKLVDRITPVINEVGVEYDLKDSSARGAFSEFGRALARSVRKMGEEHKDQTYLKLLEVASKMGRGLFPHAPQRLLEIAYLATQPIEALPILEATPHRLTYQIERCAVFEGLKAKCGESAAVRMVCRDLCLALCETLNREGELGAEVNMEASTAKDGLCRFALSRK